MGGWKRRSDAVPREKRAAHVTPENRGAVSHKRDQEQRLLDPSRELEVLKCIMLREGYLARVRRLAEEMSRRTKRVSHQPQPLPPGLVDLLDLLRVATIDTVEAISLWRLSQATPAPTPFEWNGRNYLTKMLQDCDFLDRVETLRSWFGFPISGNPFFFPQQSTLSDIDGKRSTIQTSKQPGAEGFELDKSGMADVGRQPWLGPLEVEAVDDGSDIVGRGITRGRYSKKRRVQKLGAGKTLAPYAAAIINDHTLLPKLPTPTRLGDSESGGRQRSTFGAHEITPVSRTVDTQGVVPNLVSREDIRRIAIARQSLIEEQARVREASIEPERKERGGPYCRRRPSEAADVDSGCLGLRACDSTPARRPSAFRRRAPGRKGSATRGGKLELRSTADVQGRHNMPSMMHTTAGLLQRPSPEPHPALGPVLLRSDCPGGELHPNPFLHTVAEDRFPDSGDLGEQIVISSPRSLCVGTRNRCATAPMHESSQRRRSRRASGPSVMDQPPRPATALARIPATESLRRLSSRFDQKLLGCLTTERDVSVVRSSCPGDALSQERPERSASAWSGRMLGLSRKAGAELRALTAAGTTGRRQPPIREERQRRLARDVVRYSAELRRLVVEEEQLRRDLIRCFCTDRRQPERGDRCRGVEDIAALGSGHAIPERVSVRQDGGTTRGIGISPMDTGTSACAKKRMESSLEEKRHEIECKTFSLSVKRDELRCLRIVQKQEHERKDALELDGRRAHLGAGQTLPEDNEVAETLEDSSCIVIQKRVRGIAGRKYAAWYKENIQQAATTIQRGVRFIWDRRATRRRLLLNASARPMQATIRMFIARQRYMRLLRQRRELLAACKLQVAGRGMLGRRRAAARRLMLAAATKALGWVSLEKLQPRHLKELARAIHGALVDPVRQFPPAGVLGALRAVLTILDDAKEKIGDKSANNDTTGRTPCSSTTSNTSNADTVTFQTALGRTVKSAISAPDLTWEMAARVLGRPFRLLRRMRAFASGLGASSDASPARLIHLSPQAAKLLSAYRSDPSWSFESLSAMEYGGTGAKALVGWATELEKVYREQPRVQIFLRDAQPAWLRKGRSFQKRRRALELRVECCRQAVKVATQYRQQLESKGRAYGDPMLASEELERQCKEAEEALRELERKRNAFLAVQAGVTEAEGKALRDSAEFAEREASVAAREEEMAIRLGQSGPEELEDLAGKTRDCRVIVRELLRRMRVWERRCEEENRPLLAEWIPPTEDQKSMSRALGEVRAWEQITAAQKARLIEDAGGRRFLKGLTGKDMEAWTSAAEGLEACRADIESKEARLAEDVGRFELELSRRNEEIAAEKVTSAPWDNATEETQALEKQEDADAARDELRTAMGATLPPGMLGNPTEASACNPAKSGPSQRPTLLLLGLDLPASVRNGIRARLDRDTPGFFGHHITGAEALPSMAPAAQATAGQGFLGPCRDQSTRASKPSSVVRKNHGGPIGGSTELGPTTPGAYAASRGSSNTGDNLSGSNSSNGLGQAPAAATSRADVVQTLSAGKNVSLEVVPGPGLWTRGRFLRDLEALLGGLDDGAYGGDGNGNYSQKRVGPTVFLIDGHGQNRSGGGSELSHGTNFAGTTTRGEKRIARGTKPDCLLRQGPESALHSASLAAMRLKALMEEAAQRLHDLSKVRSEAPWPFKAITSASGPSTSRGTPRGAHERREEVDETEYPRESRVSHGIDVANYQDHVSVSARAAGRDLLLAACHIMVHPERRYYVGEGQPHREWGPQNRGEATDAAAHSVRFPVVEDVDDERAAVVVYASRLAATCRKELAERQSPKSVAAVLRRVDLEAIPLETAVALRYLSGRPAWPATSPRSDFVGCAVSEAFVGWIVAAVAAATELALEGGGGASVADAGLRQEPLGGVPRGTTRRNDGVGLPPSCGSVVVGSSNVEEAASRFTRGLTGAQAERQQERARLGELEKSLIDEIVTVLDDDSPWSVLSGTTDGDREMQGRRQCRASDVFNAVLTTSLRPFKVFEVVDCKISLSTGLQPTDTASPRSASQALASPSGPTIACESDEDGDRFCITLSRAFGSIYAQAVSLGTGRIPRGHTVMARTKEEDLIPLLSPNWMEKHDLSALRELRTEPAVWRALVDTLALSSPNKAASVRTGDHQSSSVHTLDYAKNGVSSSQSADGVDHRRPEQAASGPPESGRGSFEKHPACDNGGRAAVLHFRHERRLTLETSCLLMGRVVPVSVYEECRSDFWCEAQVPAALTSLGEAACPTEMRVPKECIPLILEDDHPMRMRTILDASDLRQLSVLIADRLKLCRSGSARKRQRSYLHWLDSAIGSGNQPVKLSPSVGFLGTERHANDRSGPEFKLTLRKRSVGQVVFSRLVSFWVSCWEDRDLHRAIGGRTTFVRNALDSTSGNPNRSETSARHVIQRLVTVKDFSHRGGCGELRVEVHDPFFGCPVESFHLTPQLTSTLLGDWRAALKKIGRKRENPSLRYWREALTWRLRIVPHPAYFVGSGELQVDENDVRPSSTGETRSSSVKGDESIACVSVDERTPLCCLRGVAARLETTSVDIDERGHTTPSACNNLFDLLVLPVHPKTSSAEKNGGRRRQPAIQFVATHRGTMAVFSFFVPIKAFAKELDAFLAACLTAPTSLSMELELASPNLALRGLAEKWLRYSPGEDVNGNRAVLALSFGRTTPITAEPIVGLRRTRHDHTCALSRGAIGRHTTFASDDGVRTTVDRESLLDVSKVASGAKCRETHGSTHRGTKADTVRRDSCRSVVTLQAKPRNERMVFRRRLVVPQRRDLVMRHANHGASGQRSPSNGNQGGVDEEASKLLSISVYETFTAGSSGKVERYLKFFARDETARPANEAVSTVSWDGTCEGVEGGKLWRVVTQGLSFEHTRDDTGKRVGISLTVSADQGFGESVVPSGDEKRGLRMPGEHVRTQTRGEGAGEDRGRQEPGAQTGGAPRVGDEKLPSADGFAPNDGEKTSEEVKRCRGGRQMTPTNPAIGPRAKSDDHVAPAGDPDLLALGLIGRGGGGEGEGEGEGGEKASLYLHDRPNKIYAGWHRITGIRLHVQCFQEINLRMETHGDPHAGNVDSTMACSKWRPAGRGGVSGFPPSASLRFLLCDPRNGHRTGVNVSVEDVCRNLTTDDGIVDAELLDPGRRPALAKAIAKNLRLVFEADGGYGVILPLPASWTQS